ncbi:MAG TPA: two-component system sensor histidine kinase KdpD [Rhodocyclaceae bacterium]|nr:two-component system sensor histidine kinase KdpD [Rhodocyclaceae bacterium]
MAADDRPDPDALLAQLEAEQAKAQRGKLKIFFGASPGVGKTYAMLSAARLLVAQGVDLVVGVVETHGRAETMALAEGLEILPRLEIEYRGHTLREFDLDAALARKPALILMDELAHSNAPGSRHPKRWQDIEELLDAGIDVYTTVNVQHIDSLNDVVGGITGARIWETVPDKVFDAADEVVLVDLPPDELLQRLKEGKVYIPQQAERAMANFFRKGNLLALREISLRRTADRVDEDVLAYRRSQSVSGVWPMQESLLVCIGPGPGGEKLIRNAARVAAQSEAPWHAVYVETPKLQRKPDAERAQMLKMLKLAQDAGARTAVLSGPDAAQAAIAYARQHNLGKVMVGRDRRPFWDLGFAYRLGRQAPDLDVIQVAHAPAELPPRRHGTGEKSAPVVRRADYAWAVAIVVAVTVVATPLAKLLDLANIVMLFLLGVFFTAVRLGRGPALLSAFLAVAAFDFFFVPPQLSFAVSDVQYLVTFAVMLIVALITGQLTAGLRFQVTVAQGREQRTLALYEMARELSAALTVEQIAEITERFVAQGFNARATLMLLDARDRLAAVGGSAEDAPDIGIAQWAFDHGETAGLSTDTLPSAPMLYVPLKAPMRTRGILALRPRDLPWLPAPEQQRLLDTSATLIAIAIERVHYISVAQDALVHMESERLRNSLLSALSHDLRTPLTALAGLAESLTLAGPSLPKAQAEIAQAIREEALRTSALVNNLLDMARLETGSVKLTREWQPLEEVVGVALQARASVLAHHAVRVDLPADLPLLEFDAVLMERVFCNLLENAAKYTPAGSRIEIAARRDGDNVEISVADNGPGLPPGKEEALFEKFARGHEESAVAGVGLGLAIVRAVVEVHKGSVRAENRPEGGARFVVTLPVGEPPSVPVEA